jgi:membrane associated rhomboid family serine protease
MEEYMDISNLFKSTSFKIFIVCCIVYTLQVQIEGFNETFAFSSHALWRIDTWIVHMFMHGNATHLICNMIGVVSIGYCIENIMKNNKNFIKLFLISGVGAMALQIGADVIFYDTSVERHYVGASGALCGLVGALVYYLPNSKLLLFFILPLRTKILFWGMLGVGFVLYALNVYTGEGNVAHLAHNGGLIAGLLLAKWLSPKLLLKLEGCGADGIKMEGEVLSTEDVSRFTKLYPYEFKWQYGEDSRKLKSGEDYSMMMLTSMLNDLIPPYKEGD